MSTGSNKVLAEIKGRLAIATLNRPSALNTLDLQIVTELYSQIKEWEQNPNVDAIVLRGQGTRSFCSGGDVKSVVQAAREGDLKYGDAFFENEYKLDLAIHRAKKPVIVIGHGFVMGGGIGLLAGAALRIVTDSSLLAMPEITIGLFPDVGASWFLNRMPNKLGLFLALTAARFNAADAMTAELADFFIPDVKLEHYAKSLVDETSGDRAEKTRRRLVAHTHSFCRPFLKLLPNAALKPRLKRIETLMAGDEAAAVFTRLSELQNDDDPFFQTAAKTFAAGSPTSAKLIFEQLQKGRSLSLEQCFAMEKIIAAQCCRHHDFIEGVRALLIDKDKNPKWEPADIAEVSQNLIEQHFRPVTRPPSAESF